MAVGRVDEIAEIEIDRPAADVAELAPTGERRMGANPHTNGGALLRNLRMPDFHDHAVAVPSPGRCSGRTRWSSAVSCATSSH